MGSSKELGIRVATAVPEHTLQRLAGFSEQMRSQGVQPTGRVLRVGDLFATDASMGQILRVKNQPFKVLGVMAPKGSTGFGQDQDARVGHVAVRVHGLLAVNHADPGSLVNTGDRVLDAPIIEHELQRLVPFPEELGPIATSRQRGAERLSCFARADRRSACDCCGDDRPPLP